MAAKNLQAEVMMMMMMTDRQTDMFLFGVLYKESALTTISK